MFLSSQNINYIKDHALEENPFECCGILYHEENTGLTKAKRARNCSDKKSISFSLHPNDYFEASLLGKIKAIYHSHTNGNPNFSLKDKEHSLKHKINFLLYDIKSDAFKFFDYKENTEQILNEKFQWGKSDCISLVQRYIEKEKGYRLILPEELDSRDSKWANKNLNIVSKTFNLNKHALTQVDFSSTEDLRSCDILCFSLKRNIDHFGVYISNNNFFHHKVGKKPNCENIDQYFNKLTQVYRYNNG